MTWTLMNIILYSKSLDTTEPSGVDMEMDVLKILVELEVEKLNFIIITEFETLDEKQGLLILWYTWY